ncbi:MAG: PEP-CTERM sorting domain-containing protein [Deltaproteobacteria bacterium]|nr:PEP-CTERM sorting domain-containing protein [Deltaproteobacteria bacterium]
MRGWRKLLSGWLTGSNFRKLCRCRLPEVVGLAVLLALAAPAGALEWEWQPLKNLIDVDSLTVPYYPSSLTPVDMNDRYLVGTYSYYTSGRYITYIWYYDLLTGETHELDLNGARVSGIAGESNEIVVSTGSHYNYRGWIYDLESGSQVGDDLPLVASGNGNYNFGYASWNDIDAAGNAVGQARSGNTYWGLYYNAGDNNGNGQQYVYNYPGTTKGTHLRRLNENYWAVGYSTDNYHTFVVDLATGVLKMDWDQSDPWSVNAINNDNIVGLSPRGGGQSAALYDLESNDFLAEDLIFPDINGMKYTRIKGLNDNLDFFGSYYYHKGGGYYDTVYYLARRRDDNPSPVPEPSTVLLLGAGVLLLGLGGVRRRRTG